MYSNYRLQVSVNERVYTVATGRQVIKEKSKTQACLLCHCQPDKRTILAGTSVAKLLIRSFRRVDSETR